MTTADAAPSAATDSFPWHDSARPVAERVELLLGRMTLEEKVAQLGSRWIGHEAAGAAREQAPGEGDAPVERTGQNVAPMEDVFRSAGAPAPRGPTGAGAAAGSRLPAQP